MRISRIVAVPLLTFAVFQTGHLLANSLHSDVYDVPQVADDILSERIRVALVREPGVAPDDVTIKIDQGRVRLIGSMYTRDQVTQVEDITSRIKGVRDVTSLLRAREPA